MNERSPAPSTLGTAIRRVPNAVAAAKARLLGSEADAPDLERVAVIAKLLPGSRERAAEILAKGAPYGLSLAGFRRHSVYLAEEAVVFVFEGPHIEELVRDLVNDPARSAAFSVWAPLVDGTPVLAQEAFYWRVEQHG